MAVSPSPRPSSRLIAFGKAHYAALIVIALTILAAVLRLYHIQSAPPGLHGDEGWTGLDARRILHEGWIGPYVGSALGQPSGPLYWTALVFKIAGDGVLQLRASMALLGIITIPVCYLAVSQAFDKRVALFATALLACMGWHLLYSRTGFMVISWPLAELAVIGLTFAAYKRENPYFYAAAGAVLGLGVYSYNVYPLFVVAYGLFILALLAQSGRGIKKLLPYVVILGCCAFIVALPLIQYIRDPKNDYSGHQRLVSVFHATDYEKEGTAGRLRYLGDKAKGWVGELSWNPKPDLTDGSGVVSALDWTTALLAIGGIVLCLINIRKPQYQLLLLMLLTIPFGAILTTNAPVRRTLGLAPVFAILAAISLNYSWEWLMDRGQTMRDLGRLGLVAIVIGVGFVNVRTYFGDVIPSEATTFTYADEIAEASKYAEAQPNKPYVYFFSGRWSYDYETRRYIAPDLKGEDRSAEFSPTRSVNIGFDRSRDSLVLLLAPYSATALGPIMALYPDAETHTSSRGQFVRFVAIKIPKLSTPAPAVPAGVFATP